MSEQLLESVQPAPSDSIVKKQSAKGDEYWDIKVHFGSDSDVEDAIQRLKQIDIRMREEFL